MTKARVLLLALGLGALSASGVAGQEAPALTVARALMDAFNRHDAEAMAALVAEDFELYYVDERGAAALSTRGPDGLRRDMARYFEARPTVRSSIEASLPGPRFVALRERIEGGASSLAVYEVAQGRILRVWYYPAEP